MCSTIIAGDNTKWMLFKTNIITIITTSESPHPSLSDGSREQCVLVSTFESHSSSLYTHTQHHFTRHQTLTKSLFSAACWHSNSRLTKSHAGRILITASQSQSCMWNCYLHMRGKGFHPAHCLHTHPATRGVCLDATLSECWYKGVSKELLKLSLSDTFEWLTHEQPFPNT